MFLLAGQVSARYFILQELRAAYLILKGLGVAAVGSLEFTPYIQDSGLRGVVRLGVSRLECVG